MFRSIGSRIDRVKRNLTSSGEINNNLNRVFTRFLNEYFPECKNVSFNIRISGNRITIQAPNKVIANELILRMADLSRVLKEEKIKSDQIIIA